MDTTETFRFDGAAYPVDTRSNDVGVLFNAAHLGRAIGSMDAVAQVDARHQTLETVDAPGGGPEQVAYLTEAFLFSLLSSG
jgi:hypothetical protein